MKSLHELDAAEADQWVIRARQSLAGHATSIVRAEEPGELRVAMDAVIGNLECLAEHHPEKRARIEALVGRYRRPD